MTDFQNNSHSPNNRETGDHVTFFFWRITLFRGWDILFAGGNDRRHGKELSDLTLSSIWYVICSSPSMIWLYLAILSLKGMTFNCLVNGGCGLLGMFFLFYTFILYWRLKCYIMNAYRYLCPLDRSKCISCVVCQLRCDTELHHLGFGLFNRAFYLRFIFWSVFFISDWFYLFF